MYVVITWLLEQEDITHRMANALNQVFGTMPYGTFREMTEEDMVDAMAGAALTNRIDGSAAVRQIRQGVVGQRITAMIEEGHSGRSIVALRGEYGGKDFADILNLDPDTLEGLAKLLHSSLSSSEPVNTPDATVPLRHPKITAIGDRSIAGMVIKGPVSTGDNNS